MRPTNERRRYIVTSSLIGWVHTQNHLSVVSYQFELHSTNGAWTLYLVIAFDQRRPFSPHKDRGVSSLAASVVSARRAATGNRASLFRQQSFRIIYISTAFLNYQIYDQAFTVTHCDMDPPVVDINVYLSVTHMEAFSGTKRPVLTNLFQPHRKITFLYWRHNIDKYARTPVLGIMSTSQGLNACWPYNVI